MARDKISRNTGFWDMSRDPSTSSRKGAVSILTEDGDFANIPPSSLGRHTRQVGMTGPRTDHTKRTLMTLSKWKDMCKEFQLDVRVSSEGVATEMRSNSDIDNWQVYLPRPLSGCTNTMANES